MFSVASKHFLYWHGYTCLGHSLRRRAIWKKTVSYWQAAGFIFTSILGTFFHFLFDLSNQSIAAALFSAVNESIWEHMKLLFYPMFLFAMIENHFWGNEYDQFWCVKLIGILLGLVLIPVIYYTYTGILGVSADWFNITIFFIAAGTAFWLETILFQQGYTCRVRSTIAFALICLIAVVFTVLTFIPPRIPFFEDPVTGTYGFQR